MPATHVRPCLRPVEVLPQPDGDRVILRDPTQLAAGMLVVGIEQLHLLSLLDGTRDLVAVQADFARRTGELLFSQDLVEILDRLAETGFLDGPRFEARCAEMLRDYRDAPFRPLRDRDGFGAPHDELRGYLDDALAGADNVPDAGACPDRLAGIVVPHLDFPRGLPCYADGYVRLARLARTARPGRVVVLGTNHFGRSKSVVATYQDFETPWGVLASDRPFLDRLQESCGGTLTPHELDHLREHSIELQTLWLHHVLGEDVRIVPFLCPDPNTQPEPEPVGENPQQDGVDVKRFAVELGRLIREDPVPTLLIAAADLSHVGGYFGDERPLDEDFQAEVRAVDEAALAHVDANRAEAYREHMAATKNPTRVCSVGCIYALMTALGPAAKAERLRYHQAVTPEAENAVTCAAYAFYL